MPLKVFLKALYSTRLLKGLSKRLFRTFQSPSEAFREAKEAKEARPAKKAREAKEAKTGPLRAL